MLEKTESLFTDPLTGLYSRSAFDRTLSAEFERASRYNLPFALIVLDIDHFKSINDAFGHSRGDRALVEFAARAPMVVRSSDFIFRYGGDEFVLLLPHTNRVEAAGLANRLLAAVTATPFGGEPPLSVTISAGVAAFPEDGALPEAIFEAADRRNYLAKRAGRACVVSHDRATNQAERLGKTGRALEQEEALEQLQRFFDALPDHARGLLLVEGPEGAGHSRFLQEAAKLARLRSYAHLLLEGQPGLKHHYLGALNKALDHLSAINPDVSAVQRIEEWLAAKQYAGLVICVDDPANLDSASLAALARLNASDKIERLALCYAGRGARALGQHPSSSGFMLREMVSLTPLSQAALQIWLRHALSWEAPAALRDWFYRQTQGLPALMRAGLELLIAEGLLEPEGAGWRWLERGFEFELAERLSRQRETNLYNLPVPATELVGREQELEALSRLLEGHRLVSLVGTGGTGKSRLALQLGLERFGHYRDGVYFVGLAAIEPRQDTLLSTIITGLGQKLAADNYSEQLSGYLRERELLLILDNFEHLLEHSGLLSRLTLEAPGVRLLVTSRERLKLPGEAVLELEGLEYPAEGCVVPATAYSAGQLFLESAALVRPGFGLKNEEDEEIARIARLLRGLPLGLRLAAAWVDSFSLEDIANQLEESALKLVGPDGGGVRAVFDSFWELLSEGEQAALAGLAVFRGGFRREAARAVSQASTFLLEGLVQRSFLSRSEEGRYNLHELLRQYLAEKLGQQREEREEQHAAYYLRLAEKLAPDLSQVNQVVYLNLLEAELNNLRAAIEWYYRWARFEEGLRLAAALERFWHIHDYHQEGRRYLERGLEQEIEISSHTRGLALAAAGLLAFLQGDQQTAICYQEKGLHQAEQSGDKVAIATGLGRLGTALFFLRGDYAGARKYLERALALNRELDNKKSIALNLANLSLLALYQDDYPTATKYQLECLSIQEEIGNRAMIKESLNVLGSIALNQGDYAAAENYFRQSLELFQKIANQHGISGELYNLALVALCRGDHASCSQLFEESYRISLKGNSTRTLVSILSGWVILAAREGQVREQPERNSYLLRAVRLAGALDSWQKSSRLGLGKMETRLQKEVLEATCKELGEEAFAAAFTEGAAMPPEQALEYALKLSKTVQVTLPDTAKSPYE